MGSTFTTFPDKFDQTSIIGTKKKLPIYLQFVPGIVIDVVSTKQQIAATGNSQKISSIIAMPHETHLGIKKPTEAGEEFRYYPLLRGIQEIPTPGDPVILCTMGGVQYYLGPLNTAGSPTWNEDKFKNNQLGVKFNNIVQSEGSLETPLFDRSVLFQRLSKLLNNKLDNPSNPNKFISDTIHGDLMLEGRHGNSLRIGSRSVNPYIIISNGRSPDNPVETSLDGTILAIVKDGSIRDHFNMDPKEFTLADEEFANSKGKSKAKRSITSTFAKPLGRGLSPIDTAVTNAVGEIYNYNENQFFLSSNRITFNARKESMFLSAYKHIHIGCGSSMTFSTSKNILTEAAGEIRMRTDGMFAIECEKLYIDGRQKILLGNPILDDTMHKAVLGDALVTQLSKMFEIMKEMCYLTSKAVENRALPGGSLTTMKEIIESIDNELGMVYRISKSGPSNSRYPKGLADLILSDKVFIKK
jgi:hypothetical protein